MAHEIKVKSPKSGREVTFVNENIGNDLNDAIAKNGAEVVFSMYEDSAVIRAQARARGVLDRADKEGNFTETVEAAAQAGAAYKPTLTARTPGTSKDPVAAMLKKIQDPATTAEEKAALKKQLKDLLAQL